MNIILIGPPASGKGTQAKLLKEKFGFIHLSTGDLLREISSKQNKLANEIKSLIDNGHFVSDELIIEVVKNKLNEIGYFDNSNFQKEILFDGFPRTVFQAKELEKMVHIDYIFEIDVSKTSIVNRVLDRGLCGICGKSFLLSQTNGKTCDVCGGEIIKRKDDRKDITEERFDEYMSKTYPIIEYFKNHKGYHKIDGEQSTDLVFKEICKLIKREKI
ncbi:MAG TPA: adenylate kinase [Clostridiales bacterium]|nr:adenylate kinase [Clostridiales bacterium]